MEPKMPGDSAVTPEGTGDQMVMAALDLGWQMAELYALVAPGNLEPPALPARPKVTPVPAPGPGPVPVPEPGPVPAPEQSPPAGPGKPRIKLQADLPGAASLTDRQKRQLLFDQIDVSVRRLQPRLAAAGLTAPDNSAWPELSQHLHSAEGRYELAAAIFQFHDDMLIRLTAADHRLGQAYGLGRALADLSLRPKAANQQSFTDDLRSGGRIDVISSWLTALHTALPDHAAGAVTGSIAQWQAWAAQPKWDGAPLRWPDHEARVVAALHKQGTRWRSLLTGRAGPLDELAPEDYVDAAGYLLGRVRKILQRLLIQYWPAVLLGTLLMIGAVVAAFVVFKAPVDKFASAAVSFLAWLGITGKLVTGALQRAASQAEDSLWQCELDLAIAWAITELPDSECDRKLGEPARSIRRRSVPPPVPAPSRIPPPPAAESVPPAAATSVTIR
jgi:hypothetical protein